MHISNKTVKTPLTSISLNKISNKALNNITNYRVQDYEEINYSVPLSDIENTNYSNTDIYKSINYSNIKEDGYISQSLVRIDDKTFITAYTKSENSSTGGHGYSRIYIYDKNGNYEGKMTLNNDAHVGGISYDKENNILYVTNNKGKIDAYDYNKIIDNINTKDSNYTFYLGQNYQIPCDINIYNVKDNTNTPASTIYYDRGNLYIGKYEASEKGYLITLKPEITIDEYGNKRIKYDKDKIKIQDNLPKQIQGIATTNYNGKEYLVVSCSAGFVTNSLAPKSRLRLYEYDENTNKYNGLGFIYIGKLAEGVNIDESGNVSVIFEKEIMETYETNMEYLINNVSYDENIITETVATLGGLG